MPKFKKVDFCFMNGEVEESFSADIRINADGEFYCKVPNRIAELIFHAKSDRVFFRQGMDALDTLYAKDYESLLAAIRKAIKETLEPEITETQVIRYRIDVNASVAVDDQGNVCPNAGWPNAKWLTSEAFGRSPAGSPQSLSIQACAMTKKVIRYPGGKTEVKYTPFYAGGDHFGRENPAELLNAWNGHIYSDKAKEIPYTDENALFFHRLLLGITQIILMIQTATFEQKDLLATIAKCGNGGHLLPDLSPVATLPSPKA
ncbi:hypothetical protein ACSSZE_14735 [Acidithiobacillus caldus]